MDTPRCRAAMASYPFLREVSDLVFPLAADEVAVEPTGGTMNHFMVFSADVAGCKSGSGLPRFQINNLFPFINIQHLVPHS